MAPPRPEPSNNSGAHPIPHSPECLLCRDELTRVATLLETVVERLDKITSSWFGGSSHMTDSGLVRLRSLEDWRETCKTGTSNTNYTKVALMAAVAGAFASNTLLFLAWAVAKLLGHA